MVVTIILVCFAVAFVALWIFLVRPKEKHLRPPPGPRGLPLVGQGFNLSMNSAYLQFTDWSKEYGDIFMFSVFGTNVCVLNSPDLIWKTFYEKQLSDVTSDRPSSFIGQYIGGSYKDILFRRYDELCRKLKSATFKAMYSIGSGSEVYEMQQKAEINEYIRKITSSGDCDVDVITPLERTLCKLIGILVSAKSFTNHDSESQSHKAREKQHNSITSVQGFITITFRFFSLAKAKVRKNQFVVSKQYFEIFLFI